MGPTEQREILLERKVDLFQVHTRQKLDNDAGSDDGVTPTQLHERAVVRDEDNTHAVERVRGVIGHDGIVV